MSARKHTTGMAKSLPYVEVCGRRGPGTGLCGPQCPNMWMLTGDQLPWKDVGVWRFGYRPIYAGGCLAECGKEWATYGADKADAGRRLLTFLGGFGVKRVRICYVIAPPTKTEALYGCERAKKLEPQMNAEVRR